MIAPEKGNERRMRQVPGVMASERDEDDRYPARAA